MEETLLHMRRDSGKKMITAEWAEGEAFDAWQVRPQHIILIIISVLYRLRQEDDYRRVGRGGGLRRLAGAAKARLGTETRTL